VSEPGKLILAAVPIGNFRDASLRLISALSESDLVAAEDTRKVKRLMSDLDIKSSAKIFSYFQENEIQKIDYLLQSISEGSSVLLVSDAGMPTISDPGFKLVQAAIAANVKIEVLPGPSAPVTALALSGFATDEFTFIGFLSRKKSVREARFLEIKKANRTFIFFESPRRLLASLKELSEALNDDRQIVIARELTKTYQEIIRGNISECIGWAKNEVLGEITVVVDRASEAAVDDLSDAVTAVSRLIKQGLSHKDAVNQVATQGGLAKRALYKATLELNHERE
jgi:16S rRNA (cytidine1402-2'-O)-methyltransferase